MGRSLKSGWIRLVCVGVGMAGAAVWVACATVALSAQAGGQANAPGANATSIADSLLLPDSSKPTFTIPQAALHDPVTMVAYGDMRFTDPRETTETDPKIRVEVVKRVAAERPGVLLLGGDVPLYGGSRSDYAEFADETRVWREQNLRVFPVLGNHEFYGCDPARCLENWWHAFPYLTGRRWYSVRVGNSIEAIALDSDDSLEPGSRQAEWLARQVNALPREMEFVFIMLHHPPVADENPGPTASHNVRPNEEALRDYLRTKSAARRTNFIVIAAHIHNYERFFENGVTYLVSGGGGAMPYPVIRRADDLFKSSDFPNYHYVKFVLRDKTLSATMYRRSSVGAWQAMDRFRIAYR